MKKKPSDQFSDREAEERFKAALRGARITGHKPMKSMTPKRKKVSRQKKSDK